MSGKCPYCGKRYDTAAHECNAGVGTITVKRGEPVIVLPDWVQEIEALKAANTRLSERVKELEEENADLADLQYPWKEEHDRAETAETRVQELEKSAGEILALIHGDGGHYQAEYGTAKALRDAKDKYFECVQKRDRETTQLAARLVQAEMLLREWKAAFFDEVDTALDHFAEANNGIDHREGDFEKFFGCAPGLTGGLTAREYIDSVRGEDADHSADASKMIAVNGSQMAIDSDPITAQCWCGEYLTVSISDEGTGCYVCPVHGCYWMEEDEPKMGTVNQ